MEIREVRTVYDVSDLNKAVAEGSICIVRHKKINVELYVSALLLRNIKSGEYIVVPDRTVHQQYGNPPLIYAETEWKLVQTVERYARRNRNDWNWGAYVLPSDAAIGERFLIRNLIEDLVESTFWHSVTSAETAEAIWDGSDLNIDHSSYKLFMIG